MRYSWGMIKQNLETVRSAITHAAESTARDPKTIKLVAVSKGMEESKIRDAIESGQTIFGENRVQESAQKWPKLRAEFPNLSLHLIGALQTNKVKEALDLFDCIHTLDRESLAREIMKHRDRLPGKKFLVQINIGHEPQKSGIAPESAGEFIKKCLQDYRLPVVGLMAIPPHGLDPRPYFRQLAGIAEKHALPELSMGMSGDFKDAIAMGATMVRIGAAIFGARN